MKRLLITIVTLLIIAGSQTSAKDYTVASPNGKNVVTVNEELKILVKHNNNEIVAVKANLGASDFGLRKVRVWYRQSFERKNGSSVL